MSGNKPEHVERDGAMKFSIFVNEGENGPRLNVAFENAYFDKESNSCVPTNSIRLEDTLKLQRLAGRTYDAGMRSKQDLNQRRSEERAPAQQRSEPARGRKQTRSYSR